MSEAWQVGGGADRPRLEIGAAFSYGWAKFKENVGQWLLIALVVVVVNLVFTLFARSLDSLFMMLVVQLIGFIVGQIVTLGLIRAALDVTQGLAPDVSRVFKTEHLGTFIVASILYGIAVSVGIILCVIPGIFLAIMFTFYGYYILDRGAGATDSLGASWNLVKSNFGSILGLLILAILLNFVGLALCGVGILVTGPVTWTAIAYAYRTLNGEPVAP